MQVTLTKIVDKTKTSQRTGKDFVSRSIKTNEHGDRWISGFKGKENEHWKEGDTVEITIEEKGDFLNFSVPKTERAFRPSGDLLRVERKIDAILTEIQMMKTVIGDIGLEISRKDILAGKLNPVENGLSPVENVVSGTLKEELTWSGGRVETDEEPPIDAYDDES